MISFVYLLVGMGVVAMCYYLLKEEVTVKMQRAKEKISDKFRVLKIKLGIIKPGVN